MNTNRAEAVPATIHHEMVAQLIPMNDPPSFRLASTRRATSDEYNIVEVNGQSIDHLEDLIELTEQTSDDIAVRVKNLSSSQDHELILGREQVAELRHRTGNDGRTLRLTNAGRTRALVRGAAASCELSARVERSRGILMLDVSIETARGGNHLLPAELSASCNGQPLGCLNASQALELLYGQQPADAYDPSFAVVSEREDYLVTASFQELEDNLGEQLKGQPPALVSIPGIDYPGSPILGDARALSGYLLQRQIARNPGDRSTGWVLFAGEEIKSALEVKVTLDLGDGERSLTLSLPN